MARFVRGADRDHVTPLPNRLDAYLSEDDPVRVVDVFVDALNLAARGFEGVVPAATGRPGYHPATLPQRDLYGYLDQVASSRRPEREAGRNVEPTWLTGRLVDRHTGSLREGAAARTAAQCRRPRAAGGTSTTSRGHVERGTRREPESRASRPSPPLKPSELFLFCSQLRRGQC